MPLQKINNKIAGEKSAKKRLAILAYEQEFEIPVKIGIPIKVINYEDVFVKSKRKGIFSWNIFRHIAKIVGVFLMIFVFVAQAAPFTAYEAHIINVTAKICNFSQTRTIGYWKNHPEVYDPALLPQTLGGIGTEDLLIENQTEVNIVFDDYNLSMRNKLRGQLLAMKFNIAAFGIGGFEYFVFGLGTTTMDNLVVYADNLLSTDPAPPNSVLENIKDALDSINNLHKINFCGSGGQGGPGEPDKVLINKVYYDVDDAHGKETKKEWNEWVELYNPSDSPLNISNWIIEDNNSQDTLSSSSAIIIPALGFAIITGTSTTWNYWNIPAGVIKIELADGKIGNGLANDGDRVVLKDTEGTIVDMMSYGLDTFAFDPSVAVASEGDELARFPIGVDTDTAADWRDLALPSLAIINPIGGETWYVGHTYDLQWTAANPNGDDNELKIDIYYSGDSGLTWAQIIMGTENDGSYSWYISLFLEPGHYYVPSPHARIKIVATGPENFMAQGQVSSQDFCPPIDYDSLSTQDQQLVDQLILDGVIDESEVIRGGVDKPAQAEELTQEIVQEPAQDPSTSSGQDSEITTSSEEIIEEIINETPVPDASGGGQTDQPAQISEPAPIPEEPVIEEETAPVVEEPAAAPEAPAPETPALEPAVVKEPAVVEEPPAEPTPADVVPAPESEPAVAPAPEPAPAE